MRRACMIELEFMTAMRRGTLSRLRSDVHLERHRTAEGEFLFLDIDGRETKNGEPGGYPLPQPTAEILLFYLEKCRPILDPTAQGWFYPGEEPGEPLCEDQVSREIQDTVFDNTGLKLTAHAFRHLVGMLHLKEHPGELEVLRRFYNHRSIEVTTNNYVGFDATAAARRVDAHILALRAAIPDPGAE